MRSRDEASWDPADLRLVTDFVLSGWVTHPVVGGGPVLTPREKDVLRLLAAGGSNADIFHAESGTATFTGGGLGGGFALGGSGGLGSSLGGGGGGGGFCTSTMTSSTGFCAVGSGRAFMRLSANRPTPCSASETTNPARYEPVTRAGRPRATIAWESVTRM